MAGQKKEFKEAMDRTSDGLKEVVAKITQKGQTELAQAVLSR